MPPAPSSPPAPTLNCLFACTPPSNHSPHRCRRHHHHFQSKLEKLRAELAKASAERVALDQEILSTQEDEDGGMPKMTGAQLEEYEALKAQSTSKAAGLVQKADVLAERRARLQAKQQEVRPTTTALDFHQKHHRVHS